MTFDIGSYYRIFGWERCL